MVKVGITGGIGSGKSVVCKIFQCLGVPVYHADKAGRHLLDNDEAVKAQVTGLFGDSVLTNGALDRQKIATIVFRDKEKLAQLNSIIHPAVRKDFEKWVSAQTSSLTVEEAAILFESGAYKNLDVLITVTAPEVLRIQRVMQRDGASKEEVLKRMANQWSEEEKAAKSHYVIKNDGTTMLIPQVMDIYKTLSSRKKG